MNESRDWKFAPSRSNRITISGGRSGTFAFTTLGAGLDINLRLSRLNTHKPLGWLKLRIKEA
jgi:hypothetical protein